MMRVESASKLVKIPQLVAINYISRFTGHQLERLEEAFRVTQYPDQSYRERLAAEIQLSENCVQVRHKGVEI